MRGCVVTEKLTVVTDVGRRKLSVVTDGAPEKGRRYHTFSHTERASVATIYPATVCTEYAMHMLSIYMHLIEYVAVVKRLISVTERAQAVIIYSEVDIIKLCI